MTEQPKRVLFVVEDANLQGGTEILTFNLLGAFNKSNYECKILSLVPYKGEDKNVMSLSKEDYARWISIKKSISDHIFLGYKGDRILKEILRNEIKKFSPNLIINQTYDIITALPYEMNIAQVFNWSVRGYESSFKYQLSKKPFLQRKVSFLLNKGLMLRRRSAIHKINRLVVLTNTAKKEIYSLCKEVVDSQVTVIPNPLIFSNDSEAISNLANKNVVFVGRLSHEKGVMRLLRIWKLVSDTLPDFSLTIYGEGPARTDMESYIKENNIESVKFKGFCKNLFEIYPNADLLCMTSDTEGFGMVLIEAMYFGVPCVSFDCPVSPKEIIGNAGVIVPHFDEKAFADNVIKLLSSPQIIKEYQGKSIQRAKDFYLDNVIDKWKTLLHP